MPTIIIGLYQIFSWCFHYILKWHMKIRVMSGKEDMEVLDHRFADYNTKMMKEISRMIQDKDVICFHAASAGEFNAIKILLKKIDDPSKFILITTATKSGAQAFKNYNHPTSNIYNVYVPYDTPQAINTFLKFWKPVAIILVESEIWPNMILQGSKIASMSIISGRMSKKSFTKWVKFKDILKVLLSHFTFVGTSTQTDYRHYKIFYENTYFTGNLKYDAERLPVSTYDLEMLKDSIGKRPVFVCASTHPGEEKMLIDAYKILIKTLPDLLIIIAPRHIERGSEIHKLCFSHQLLSICRSDNNDINNHIPSDTNVYIFNTLGELGLIFSVSKVVFLGGSLIKVGGHNMYEPTMFGCCVVTGKYTDNFADVVDGMLEFNGLVIVSNVEELTQAVFNLLASPTKAQNIANNGMAFLKSNAGALEMTISLLKKYQII